MECLTKECEDTVPEVMAAAVKGIPGGTKNCADSIVAFTCDFETSSFFEVHDQPYYVGRNWCCASCSAGAAGPQKCKPEAPLPEGISNTEVTPEGKEAFVYYMECLTKECEDTVPEVMAAAVKGIPGGTKNCADSIVAFTCDFETSSFFEVHDQPYYVGRNWCCASCSGASPASGPSPGPDPSAESKPAPKPAPRPAPSPSPSPAPSPASRDDSSTDGSWKSRNGLSRFIIFEVLLLSLTLVSL